MIDLSGARLSVPPHMYDKVSRAGITNVRIAQYKQDVVRLVLELDSSREYEITRNDNEIRVSVTGAEKFVAWHAGDKSAVSGANGVNSRASAGTVIAPEREGRTFAASSPLVGSQTEKRTTFRPRDSSWMPKYPWLKPHAMK